VRTSDALPDGAAKNAHDFHHPDTDLGVGQIAAGLLVSGGRFPKRRVPARVATQRPERTVRCGQICWIHADLPMPLRCAWERTLAMHFPRVTI
jgi:hypothetical protein